MSESKKDPKSGENNIIIATNTSDPQSGTNQNREGIPSQSPINYSSKHIKLEDSRII